MKENRLTKHITYLPNESLAINGIENKWDRVILLMFPMFFGGIILFAAFFNEMVVFMILASVGVIAILISESKKNASQYIEFSNQRVLVKNKKEDTEGREQSYFLKTPIFIDVIIRPKNDLLHITLEQYGKKIGKAIIPSDDLTVLLDGLTELLGLEIQDTRSTQENDDVLYLRPKDSSDDLMPSYIKIIENPMRLIVNPTSTDENFIINYHRKIIKTGRGNTVSTDDIKKIIIRLNENKVTISGLHYGKINFSEIIYFETKNYNADILKKDLEHFAKFLKSKPVLQHIEFEIKHSF